MTPHAAKMAHPDDLLLYNRIRHAVTNLPDNLVDEDGRPIVICCHKLARAVSTAFHVVKVDGFYKDVRFPHSWIETDNDWIIDVYPIATVGGPILIDTRNSHSLFLSTYIPIDDKRRRPNFNTNEFRQQVAIITQALRKQQPHLPLG